MAGAIKCDICGKYSDDFGLSVDLRINTVHGNKELCRDCGEKIAKFIEENLIQE
ncbi:hypothetical protein KAT24_01660 [Candidatus Pacearchaeota archaeon]|nr:hypothetical protein [Candidatus Pacearchaeota archaeon]